MKYLCGVDEAGRGPVIGPMVICGIVIDADKKKTLQAMEVKDSKLLTKKQREQLFKKIKEFVHNYYSIILMPEEIDRAVSKNKLNWLEAKKTAEIINFLNPDEAILDCPNPNTKSYENYIKRNLIKKETVIRAEHKADFNYPVVSAASILAKVIRDSEIEKIKEEIGIDFGSGYPSDPVTQKFVEEHWHNPLFSRHFRKSWAPWKLQKEMREQRKLGEF